MLVILILLAAIAAAVWAFAAAAVSVPSTLVRSLIAVSMISCGAVVLKTVASVAAAPSSDINACQLAPIVAMTRHQPLYPDPLVGALSSWTDGPLAAVLLMPASVGKGPTSQIILGVCLNLLFILVPTFVLLRQIAGSRNLMLWLCMTLIAWWMTGLSSLNGISFAIGADALALGLLVASIACLGEGQSTARVIFSAACMALACWTKLGILPVIGVLTIYLAIAQSLSRAGIFFGVFMGAACLLGLFFLPIFGATNIWFHVATLPMAQPWIDATGQPVLGFSKIVALGGAILNLIHETRIPLMVLAALGLLTQLLPTRSEQFQLKRWLVVHSWVLVPVSAIALMPAALFTFLKLGRNPESFGMFGLLIAISASAIVIRMYRRAELADDSSSRQIMMASICILLVWESIGTLFTAGGIPSIVDAIQHASANKQESALAFSQAHPNAAYFPWNTLSTLLSDGKLYASDEALRLRTTNSTIAPSVSQLSSQLPANLRWIAMDPSHSGDTILRIFPRAIARVDLPGLEGFAVYTEPGVGAP